MTPRWNDADDPKVWAQREKYLRDRALYESTRDAEHEHCPHAYSTECCECAGESCTLAPNHLSHLEAFYLRRIEEPMIRLWIRGKALLCRVGIHAEVDWEKGSWYTGRQIGLCLECRRFVVRRGR